MKVLGPQRQLQEALAAGSTLHLQLLWVDDERALRLAARAGQGMTGSFKLGGRWSSLIEVRWLRRMHSSAALQPLGARPSCQPHSC